MWWAQGLWAKSCRGHAHLDGCFAHPVKGVTAGFRRWALFDQVAKDGSRGKHGKIDIIKRLLRADRQCKCRR